MQGHPQRWKHARGAMAFEGCRWCGFRRCERCQGACDGFGAGISRCPCRRVKKLRKLPRRLFPRARTVIVENTPQQVRLRPSRHYRPAHNARAHQASARSICAALRAARNALQCVFNFGNALYIKTHDEADSTDDELLKLLRYLQQVVAPAENVRALRKCACAALCGAPRRGFHERRKQTWWDGEVCAVAPAVPAAVALATAAACGRGKPAARNAFRETATAE